MSYRPRIWGRFAIAYVVNPPKAWAIVLAYLHSQPSLEATSLMIAEVTAVRTLDRKELDIQGRRLTSSLHVANPVVSGGNAWWRSQWKHRVASEP